VYDFNNNNNNNIDVWNSATIIVGNDDYSFDYSRRFRQIRRL